MYRQFTGIYRIVQSDTGKSGIRSGSDETVPEDPRWLSAIQPLQRILAQASRSVTARLKTGLPGCESGSAQK
jgi:hypothetical protein